ncbi:D-alanyl-D-alanine carboxypeptidase/D-alanyl-D-alanine-endopeptidase [Rapidithrix thailandica]|uniref:D-alanyl-D-alanine carboxypeptidase/D-alanyl-D-alanine-endopeptidase n=1 Tax=Rapidithrix thailandica TaxID=413964 RepID=A0AAW9S7U8_9BACT
MKLIFTLPALLLVWCSSQLSSGEYENEEKILYSGQTVVSVIEKHKQNIRAMNPATIGVYVTEVESGKELVNYQGDLSLATGSTMKAITTATALAVLGDNFTFKTKIERSGKVEGGTLQGDLYITGGGDPTFGAKNYEYELDLLASKVKESGITSITGNIVADASIYNTQLTPNTWQWEDMGNYYGAGASGLSIHQNLYYVDFQPGKTVGSIAKVLGTRPEIPGLSFVNEMKTGKIGSGDNGYIYGAPFSYIRHLRGSVPAGVQKFSIKGSIPDPALFFAQALKKALLQRGIAVTGAAQALSSQEVNKTLIYTHHSETLKEIVKTTNHKSNNLYAEAILKMLGKAKGGEGSTEAGTEVIKAYWAGKGIDVLGFTMEDGSGLSRANGLTARQMGTVMAKSASSTAFVNSLPVWGQSGTVRSMGKGSVAQGKVRTKSGYIKRVRAYTGYAETVNGKQLAFAVMVNNYHGAYSSLNPFFVELMNTLVHL